MKKFAGLLLIVLISTSAALAQKDVIKILFLGNSYTYYNGLPSLISDMALRNDKKVVVTQITRGGNLLDHYAKSDFVLETINEFDFDFVVLQEQSTAPLFAAEERTYPGIRKLDTSVRENGGQTVLFMPWAREYADSLRTKMLPGKFYYDVFDSYNTAQDSLANSYYKIANEVGAKVAPAGLVWKEFHSRHPEVQLWRPDHNHPLEIGTVIAAYAIYKTIFDEPAKGVRCPLPISKNLVNEIKQITDELITDSK
ncbi:hypothetical protein [uncultured Draconibacterium sp.]|uniref:hypothetical protein n=1 Tax=uncultured Draconibacterium sp. TaxID=1573823 RepID=UPI002AA6F155|nr:hypothetical protein [uncultured Draconibacterium sp.]